MHSSTRIRTTLQTGLVAFALLGLGNEGAASALSVSPNLPADPPKGASPSTLADFAWNQFIALNWPAANQTGKPSSMNPYMPTRGTPDTSAKLGSGSPVVWGTMRAKVEILPGMNDPHGSEHTSEAYGWDELPVFVYQAGSQSYNDAQDKATIPADGQISRCQSNPFNPDPGTPPDVVWHNVDETTQIGLNAMYAGAGTASVPGAIPDQAQRLFFEAKGNLLEYYYAAANRYYKGGGTGAFATTGSLFAELLAQAQATNPTGIGNSFSFSYTVPMGTYISLPPNGDGSIGGLTDTIEFKAGWRRLTSNDDASRFYTTWVRWYSVEDAPSGGKQFCFNDEEFGLLGLHIIRKTANYPTFIFSTFEQIDNIQAADGTPVENPDGSLKSAYAGETPFNPNLAETPATPSSHARISPNMVNCNPSQQLYYVNSSGNAKTPQGTVCVNHRVHELPSAITSANSTAQQLLKKEKGPWQYYKLVNVQATPIDKSQMTADNQASFYLANSTIETNTALQLFSGRLDPCSGYAGLTTDYFFYNSNGTCNATDAKPFYNVFSLDPPLNATVAADTKTTVTFANTGGCQGCHGNAQVGPPASPGKGASGQDFSFVLSGYGDTKPDTIEATSSLTNIFLRYRLTR